MGWFHRQRRNLDGNAIEASMHIVPGIREAAVPGLAKIYWNKNMYQRQPVLLCLSRGLWGALRQCDHRVSFIGWKPAVNVLHQWFQTGIIGLCLGGQVV